MTDAETSPLWPTHGQPEYAAEFTWEVFDGEPESVDPATVGWDLSFGSRLNFEAPAGDGEWRVLLSLSDDAIANRQVLRAVTREQIVAFAQHLLTLVDAKPVLTLTPEEG